MDFFEYQFNLNKKSSLHDMAFLEAHRFSVMNWQNPIARRPSSECHHFTCVPGTLVFTHLESNYCGILKSSCEWQAGKCLHITWYKSASYCSADCNSYNYSLFKMLNISRTNTKSSPSALTSPFSTENRTLSSRACKLTVCHEMPQINITPSFGINLTQSDSTEPLFVCRAYRAQDSSVISCWLYFGKQDYLSYLSV